MDGRRDLLFLRIGFDLIHSRHGRRKTKDEQSDFPFSTWLFHRRAAPERCGSALAMLPQWDTTCAAPVPAVRPPAALQAPRCPAMGAAPQPAQPRGLCPALPPAWHLQGASLRDLTASLGCHREPPVPPRQHPTCFLS